MKKIPLFKQKSPNECGPTCIQMLSAFYGKYYNIDTILEYCELTKAGVSIRDIINVGHSIGFHAASFSVNPQEARRIPVPAIIYLKQGHFVILEAIKLKKGKYHYQLVDPDYGKVELSEDALIEKWMNHQRGFGVLLVPQENFLGINPEKNLHKKNKAIYRDIISVVKKNKRNFIWVTSLTALVLATNWAMPVLLQKTIDDGIIKKDINFVWLMLLAQFIFFLGFMFSNTITNLISAKTSFKINIDFVQKYLNKLIKLPIKFFDTTFRSDLIQRLSDLNRINTFITDHIIDITFSVINMLVFSVILIVYNYKIFLLFSLFSLLSIIYTLLFLKKRRGLDYSFFSLDSERRNSIYELIMGMSEIKINNAYHSRINAWNSIENKLNKLQLKRIYLEQYISNGTGLLGRLRDIVLTGVSALYVIQDEMTIGVMMMISFVLGQLSGPISDLMSFAKVSQDLKLSYERLFDIYKRNDENCDNDLYLSKQFQKEIRLRNVYFKYPGTSNPYILENINIEIPIGKTTAIVGPSGGGKTTILKLLLGFYQPSKGKILIDNRSLSTIHLDSWRDQCGVVMQNGYIFSASIAENIALHDEEPNIEKLIYATKMANLYDFINRLPMRFNTKIGESGLDLSGGEKQRLYIARAIYRNPNMLLFDEATSSLDANNEKEIIKNLNDFYHNRTVVIIAHRLSTIKNADNIIFLNKGKVLEQGNHEKLLALKGAYYELVRNQLYS